MGDSSRFNMTPGAIPGSSFNPERTLQEEVEQMSQILLNQTNVQQQPNLDPATSFNVSGNTNPLTDVSYISPHIYSTPSRPIMNAMYDGPLSSTFHTSPQLPITPLPDVSYISHHSLPQPLNQSTGIHSNSATSPRPGVTRSIRHTIPSRIINSNVSRHRKKYLDRTTSSAGQRSQHQKIIELRPKSQSKLMKTRVSRIPPPTFPGSFEQSLKDSKITEMEINEVMSLSNQLSSTKLQRTFSQMEISDLQQYARDFRASNITLLKLMLKHMIELNRLSAKEQSLVNSYDTGLVELQKLRTLLNGFEDPWTTLNMLQNKIQIITRLKPTLENKFTSLTKQILRIRSGSPDFMAEYNKKMERLSALKATIDQLKKQQKHIIEIRGEIKIMAEAEKKFGDNYDLAIFDEIEDMEVINERMETVANLIKKLKGELGVESEGPSKEIMDVLKYYLHAESYRKSLAYQKRWLLSLLNNCHKRKGEDSRNNRVLFKHKEHGLNSKGLWKAGGFAVVAIFRMIYLVKLRTRLHRYEISTLQQALTSS